MKKILLGLGATTAMVVPLASVVACGSTSNDTVENATGVLGLHESIPTSFTSLMHYGDDEDMLTVSFKAIEEMTVYHDSDGYNLYIKYDNGHDTKDLYSQSKPGSNRHVLSLENMNKLLDAYSKYSNSEKITLPF